MAAVGPFGPDRRVVVAVSGGADSMALACLLRRWGDPLAIVVDHGLRAASSGEAAVTVARLAAVGVPARLIRIEGLRSGPALAERARAARYRALLAACREAGRPDLLVAHHRQDQVETVLLRAEAGSGAAGLAGMAAVAWLGDARVVRPLLGVAPARLRATLHAAGVDWVEDPSNADPATGRGRLRASGLRPSGLGISGLGASGLGASGLGDDAAARTWTAGQVRHSMDVALTEELAERVRLSASGHAEVRGSLSEPAWSALLWTVSGRRYPPPREGVRRLRAGGTGTLHGVWVKDGWVVREAAAAAKPAPATPGTVWDGRFIIGKALPGMVIGALGTEAARLRRWSHLPSMTLEAMPALRSGADLLAVPHLAYPDAETCLSVQVDFRPSRPLAGAPFVPATGQAG